jgi:hypothetical protein
MNCVMDSETVIIVLYTELEPIYHSFGSTTTYGIRIKTALGLFAVVPFWFLCVCL